MSLLSPLWNSLGTREKSRRPVLVTPVAFASDLASSLRPGAAALDPPLFCGA